jgi:hypothetical protein
VRRIVDFLSDPRVLCVAELLLALAATANAGAQERVPTVEAFLAHDVKLSESQLADLAKGAAVGRVLPTADGRDVAVFGAVRIDVPRSFFVDRQRDHARSLHTPTRVQAHLFGNPATLGDVQLVDVTADDVKELSACHAGECNFKLPGTEMDRVQKAVDLSGPDARARVAAYARQRMVDYVTDYRQRGNAAMVVYDDLGSVHSSDALVAMLTDSSSMWRTVPSLAHYLTSYPRARPPGATDAIFWSLDDLPHVRRILRIMHETVYSPPEAPGMTVVAAKQIYADHYFEAGLELLSAVDGTAPGGMTLVAVRRYRFDHLPSGGVLNVRGRVVGGLRDNVVADLARLKRECEAAWRTADGR